MTRHCLLCQQAIPIHAYADWWTLASCKKDLAIFGRHTHTCHPLLCDEQVDTPCILGCRLGWGFRRLCLHQCLYHLSGKTPISWMSKKQHWVARSSTEAKYRAVANTAAELSWICNLLTELGIQLPSSLLVNCDNVGATFLCANPVFHSRMKHIAIDYHFVRGQVTRGALRVCHVNTKDQLADALTKPLSRARFLELRNKIGVTVDTPSWGAC